MNNLSRPKHAEKINVLVLASYRLVHNCLQLLLESNDDVRVVDNASDTAELVRKASTLQPDVVLLCVLDEEQERIDVIPELFNASPDARVVILSSPSGVNDQLKALKMGAAGIIGMNQHSRVLIRAIRQVHQGDTWLSQKLISRILTDGQPGKNGKENGFIKGGDLTGREREVIRMIGLGLKNKEISERLFISEATVRHHLSSIYGKLGVDDRLNLVIHAYRHGLVSIGKETAGNGH